MTSHGSPSELPRIVPTAGPPATGPAEKPALVGLGAASAISVPMAIYGQLSFSSYHAFFAMLGPEAEGWLSAVMAAPLAAIGVAVSAFVAGTPKPVERVGSSPGGRPLLVID